MPANSRSKFAVLGFLTWKPMSGYDLKKAVESSISNFWSESYGQIYPILRQLTAEGLTTRETTVTEGGRPQHVYAITPAGRAALARWLAEPASREPTRNELLLKIFFGSQGDIAGLIAHLEESERRNRIEVAKYAEISREISQTSGDLPEARFWMMTVRYYLRVCRAAIDWAAETRKELEAIKAAPSAPAARHSGVPAPPKTPKPAKPRKPRAGPARD